MKWCCLYTRRDKDTDTDNYNDNSNNSNNSNNNEIPMPISAIFELKKLSQANMSTDSSMFHTTDHVDAVADFMQKALACLRIRTLDDTRLGSREDFDRVMISAAYMHDVCHPAGNADERLKIERLASEIRDPVLDSNDVVHRRSMEILKSIDKVLTDIKNAKLEALHALVGVHYACGPLAFSTYQKQFMMCMILATDLCSYSDIASIDMIEPTVKDYGKVLIRCSDLSHFTMPWKQHLIWVKRLCKELSIDLSPEKQVHFIDTFVLPHFKALNCFLRCEESLYWIACVHSNRSVWESMMHSKVKKSSTW